MTEPAITIGDKLHVMTRRKFEDDVRRHFAGEVVGMSDGLHRVRGYTFVFTAGVNEYRKRPDLRTRIFSLGEDGLIVNVVPREVDIESLEYRSLGKRLVVTDGVNFNLDINEFGDSR